MLLHIISGLIESLNNFQYIQAFCGQQSINRSENIEEFHYFAIGKSFLLIQMTKYLFSHWIVILELNWFRFVWRKDENHVSFPFHSFPRFPEWNQIPNCYSICPERYNILKSIRKLKWISALFIIHHIHAFYLLMAIQ